MSTNSDPTPAPVHRLVGRISYTEEELEKYWPAKCPRCGWRGLSRDCAGGDSIADTGDYTDLICPICVAPAGKYEDGYAVFVLDDDPPNSLFSGTPQQENPPNPIQSTKDGK